MQVDYTARQAKLRALPGVEVVVLVPGMNMLYFTGLDFHLSERPILAAFTPDKLAFLIPELEMPKLNERPELAAEAFPWADETGYAGALQQMVKSLGLDKAQLAVDGMTMRVFELQAFEKASVTGQVGDVGQDLLNIRAIKAQDEIEAMRQANRLSEQALQNVLDWVKPGQTEVGIAQKLADELSAVGAGGDIFALVQIGERSALPHGFAGDRALGEDDILLIDFGGRYAGYPADITRTFCLGTPTDQMQEIYDVVLRANEAAKKVAGPGVPCGDVDKAARDVITEAGYGEYFIHRTGHGLGLDIHELPQMASGVDAPLLPGMVFTIEPGIYLPGVGGVRIEDDVAVTEDGIDVLTEYPRQLTL
jgi:Xaa-Pro dipeptidase